MTAHAFNIVTLLEKMIFSFVEILLLPHMGDKSCDGYLIDG